MPTLEQILSPEKALIFRITHVDNLPFILEHGIHCRTSAVRDDEFITIGNADLIDKRRTRVVPIAPGGTLEDYVAFYFTPHASRSRLLWASPATLKRSDSESTHL